MTGRGVDGSGTDLRGGGSAEDGAGEREDLRAELTAARQELRRAHDALATTAGQLGHDLRNPLTSVSMSLQMLRDQPSVAADAEAMWMVDRALSGIQRMDELIERLTSQTGPAPERGDAG